MSGSVPWEIREGDALDVLRDMPEASVQTCVTSPPYWGLRDYGVDGQIGLEPTPDEYVERLVEVFREVRRVLRDDGTLWLNLGDSYATGGRGGGMEGERGDKQRSNAGALLGPKTTPPPNLKPKDLVGIPWRVAFALQADGWYLRSDIIWAKPNPMPESVTDRPTKAHEYLFLLAKSGRYYYDADAIREPHSQAEKDGVPMGNISTDWKPREGHGKLQSDKSGYINTGAVANRPSNYYGHALGRNRRSVWTVPTQPFAAAHFAVFPPALVEPCILAGAPKGGTVLDPFAGSGTVGVVCRKHQRLFIGIELNP